MYQVVIDGSSHIIRDFMRQRDEAHLDVNQYALWAQFLDLMEADGNRQTKFMDTDATIKEFQDGHAFKKFLTYI